MNYIEYTVIEVEDLPGEHEWMMLEEPFRVTFAVKRGCWRPSVIAEGWAAYRHIMRGTPTRPPLYSVPRAV
jgi:hypothetical protein